MNNDPRAVLDQPAPPPDLTLRYGDLPDHVIDVRLPPAGQPRKRLVVFIHGGFWRAEFDRTHTGPLAADLAARGWPVACIEYRRVGQPGGGYPGTLVDVSSALSRIPWLMGEIGVDGDGAIVAGHSAGGHLALWVAATRTAAATVAGVLALAPVCDLVRAHADGLGQDAVAGLLGGSPETQPHRYAVSDPTTLDPPPVPVVLLHGTDDDRVPVSQSRAYAARTGCELRELPGVEHFAVIDPGSDAWPHVLDALIALDQQLTADRPAG